MPDQKDTLAELLIAETLTRMDGKLDKLDDRLDEHGKLFVAQQSILAEHMRRSDLLEKKIELETAATKAELPKVIEAHLKTREEELAEKRQKRVLFWLKVAGGISALGGSSFGLMHLLKFLGSLVGA